MERIRNGRLRRSDIPAQLEDSQQKGERGPCTEVHLTRSQVPNLRVAASCAYDNLCHNPATECRSDAHQFHTPFEEVVRHSSKGHKVTSFTSAMTLTTTAWIHHSSRPKLPFSYVDRAENQIFSFPAALLRDQERTLHRSEQNFARLFLGVNIALQASQGRS